MSAPIVLATCDALRGLDPDDELLRAALERLGERVDVRSWTDSCAWAEAALVHPRSTWDYPGQHDAFRTWLLRMAKVSVLVNPLERVLWNLDKAYLVDIATSGIPIVPTYFGAEFPDDVERLGRRLGASHLVVKPRISADAVAVSIVRVGDDAAIEQAFRAASRVSSVIVQPVVEDLRSRGERSLVFICGRFSHAVWRRPGHLRLCDADAWSPDTARSDEIAMAERVVRSHAKGLAYARVDFARDSGGRALVSELELIEPSLYFRARPESADRLARALVTQKRSGRALRPKAARGKMPQVR